MSQPATILDEPSHAEGPTPPRYTIDELTTATGIPSRTIRFYQSAGALQPPMKIGRIGYYGPEHVERLELIGRLQDRGLRMRAIKDLVDQIEHGELVLDEWLGLGEQLQSSWSDDGPQVLTSAQINELTGEQRPGFLAELTRQGLIESQGEERWLVHSPGLLHVASQLGRAGVHVDVAAGASKILQKHMSKAAAELAAYFTEHAGDGFGSSLSSIAEAFRVLKPLGLESVRLIFAREMEQVLRRMVESGEAAKLDKRRRRRR
ncbi:MerR family transcriptional regulator [Nannocystaceae bacterium ST9]